MNKHDVNIKKGKLINFQIGIIALISFCYVMHEVSHYTPNKKKDVASIVKDDFIDEDMGPIEVWVEPETITEQPKVKNEPIQVKTEPTATPEVVDNKTEIKPTEEKPTSTEVKTDIPTKETTTKTSGDSKVPTKTAPTVLHSRNTVDVMPVFPGCHKYSTNNELAACFQEKIQRMINKKFDRGIGEELGISGKQYITLYFEINEQGQVSNIRARNKHPEFIKEAKRVAGLLPIMEPARRSGKKVTMAYNAPIVFQVTN